MPEIVLKEGRVVERNEGEDSQRGYYGGDVQERGRTLGRRSRTGAGKESRNCPRVLFVRPQAGPQTPAGRGCGLNLPSNTHPARFSSVFAYYSALVGFLPSPSARLHAPPRALRRRGDAQRQVVTAGCPLLPNWDSRRREYRGGYANDVPDRGAVSHNRGGQAILL